MRKVIKASLFKLRRTDPEILMQRYAAKTREIFARNMEAVPVIIPSRNEEHDIVSCLIALARSDMPVIPVVVVNCSKDQTAIRARDMGAIVVEINGVKKMGATQKGLRTVMIQLFRKNTRGRFILFTDADTLVPRSWSRIMTKHLAAGLAHNPMKGAAVFGSSIFLHGPSKLADIGQSLHGFYSDIRQWIRHAAPLIRGHTYGVGLGNQDVVISTIAGLNPTQMYRDDVTIYENLRLAGVEIGRCLHVQSIVLTRGDRAHSFQEFMKNLYQPGYEESTYDRQYDLCAPDSRQEPET